MDELKHLERDFSNRLEQIRDILSENVDENTVLHVHHMDESSMDTRLNLYAKCYFFVQRQTIAEVLRTIYYMRESLKQEEGNHSLPNASLNGKFTGFVEKLTKGKYDHYDSDVVSLLKRDREYFIFSRLVRNSLKTWGVVRVLTVNAKDVTITVPVPSGFHKDGTVDYVQWGRPTEDIENLTCPPEYFKITSQKLEELVDVLEEKHRESD